MPLDNPKMLEEQTITKQINKTINSVKEELLISNTLDISTAINGKETPMAMAAPEMMLIIKIKSKNKPANLSNMLFGFAKKIPLKVRLVSGFLFKLTANARAGIV